MQRSGAARHAKGWGQATTLKGDSEAPRALVVYVPLTTQYRNSRYEVPIPRLSFLNQDSFANVQGIASLPTVRLEPRLERAADQTMDEIRAALIYALDLHAKLG
jgi:mRNA interferase MazF